MGAGSDGQRDAFFREQVGFIAMPFARIASRRERAWMFSLRRASVYVLALN